MKIYDNKWHIHKDTVPSFNWTMADHRRRTESFRCVCHYKDFSEPLQYKYSETPIQTIYCKYTSDFFILTAFRAISFPPLSHSVFPPRLFDFGFSSKTHKIKKKRKKFSWWETGTHIYRQKSTLCTDTACVCCPHTHSRTLMQTEDKTVRIQCFCKKKKRGKGRNLIGRAAQYLNGNAWSLTGRETWVFNASDLSISSSVSGPEVIAGLSKMSKTGKEKERNGGRLQDGGFPTALRCRNNLPCCASPACCPQSRSCQTASRKGAGSSHALRGGERQHTAF